MLKIELPQNERSFAPGGTIGVDAHWALDKPADRVELRLVWNTVGKGDRDLSVVSTWSYDATSMNGHQLEEVTLPEAPYSFSGKLLSLVRAFELIALPSGESTREEFVIAPNGRELTLHKSEIV